MTVAEIALVRERIDEPTTEVFTDLRVQDAVDARSGDLDLAAADLWRVKAARYAGLVNTQEGSSRRELGELQQKALLMASQYEAQSSGGGTATRVRPGRTRPITRP